jgi:hypothetical protein
MSPSALKKAPRGLRALAQGCGDDDRDDLKTRPGYPAARAALQSTFFRNGAGRIARRPGAS